MEKIPWWYTKIAGEQERQGLLTAFNNRQFSMGMLTKEAENKFAELLGVPYVILTNSGTSALTMALMAIEIKPGDEIIVPALTWIATAQAGEILGAKVILVDCLVEAPLMDVSEVEKKITSKTKAIIPVHLNGRACDLDRLVKICKERGIFIIEDTCKAMCSKSQRGYLGTIGDIGCFSLGMISLISAGGYGGFVVTKDKELYEKLKLIRDHGVRRGPDEKYAMRGFNFKISDLLAAIILAQLSQIEEKRKRVNEIYKKYEAGLSQLDYVKMIPVKYGPEISLMIDVKSKHREQIIKYLAENGIEAEKFHKPLNNAAYIGSAGNFPNANNFAEEGFVLPCGPSQPLENVDKCISLLKKWRPKEDE